MLSDQRKKQLDDIVLRMSNKNAPQKDVQLIVDDFIKKYSTEQTIQKTSDGLLEKVAGVGEFLGLGELGKGIAGSIFPYTPEAKSLIEKAPEKYEEITKPIMPTAKQVIGSAIQTAANISAMSLPSAKSVLGTAGQFAGLGTVTGAGKAMEQNKDTKNIIVSAITTGVTSGILGGAIAGLGKAFEYATKKLPTQIYGSAIKPTLEESRKAIKFQGETLPQELIKRGVVGGDEKLLKTAIEKTNVAEDRLQNLLGRSDAIIKRNDLVKYFDGLITTKKNTPGLINEAEKVRDVILEFPEEIAVKDANVIKRNIYNALRDVAFKLDPTLSTKKEAMKLMAKGIKTEIENKVGVDVVRGLNKDLATYGQLQDRIIDKLARSQRNELLGLSDYLAGGLGGATTGVPGAIAGIAGKKLALSTEARTYIPVILDRLGKVIDKIPTDTTGKISKTILLNAIKNLSNF